MKKVLAIAIEANGRYCSNDCQFMSNDAKRCELFQGDLTWNHRKKTNGNHRLDDCKRTEIKI
jgi:hypothetical protein